MPNLLIADPWRAPRRSRWRRPGNRRSPVRPLWRAAACLAAALLTGAAGPPHSPQGAWMTERNAAIVRIFPCGAGDVLCGRLVWFRTKPNDPDAQTLDVNNPDPARRAQPLCGLTLMSGFKSAGPEDWEDGTIYDPDNGKSYRATLKLLPDGTLRVRGYIGIPLLGGSEVWTQYTQPVPHCPADTG